MQALLLAYLHVAVGLTNHHVQNHASQDTTGPAKKELLARIEARNKTAEVVAQAVVMLHQLRRADKWTTQWMNQWTT